MHVRTLLIGAALVSSILVAGLGARMRMLSTRSACPFAVGHRTVVPQADGLDAERTRWDQEVRATNPAEASLRFAEWDTELRSSFGAPETQRGMDAVEWISGPARQLERTYRNGDHHVAITLTNLGGTFLLHRHVRSTGLNMGKQVRP